MQGPFARNANTPQARELIAWWPGLLAGSRSLLDMSHTRAYDATHSLIADNGGDWIPGRRAGESGLVINDSCGYLCPTSEPVWNFASYTLSAWVRSDDFGSSRRRVICRQGSGAGPYWIMALNANVLEFGDSVASILTTKGSALNDNAWHHIAVVRVSGDACYWYVDGAQIGTQAASSTTAHSDTSQIDIGKYSPSNTEHLHGAVLDIRVYNRALTALEIWELWNPATRYELYQPYREMSGFASALAAASTARSQIIICG